MAFRKKKITEKPTPKKVVPKKKPVPKAPKKKPVPKAPKKKATPKPTTNPVHKESKWDKFKHAMKDIGKGILHVLPDIAEVGLDALG